MTEDIKEIKKKAKHLNASTLYGRKRYASITPEHTLDQITQWTPEVLPTCQPMLINEEDVVLEAGVQMGFEAQVNDHGVVVAVNVCIHSVQTLEDLTE